MWNRTTRCLFYLVLGLFAAGRAASQQSADRSAILEAALKHVREGLPTGPIRMDARVAQSKPGAGRWARTPRPPGEVGALAAALGASVGTIDETRVCTGAKARSCRLEGASAVVAIGEPVIEGAVAEVLVLSWFTRTSRRGPVAARDVLITLSRESGTWRVVSEQVQRAT